MLPAQIPPAPQQLQELQGFFIPQQPTTILGSGTLLPGHTSPLAGQSAPHAAEGLSPRGGSGTGRFALQSPGLPGSPCPGPAPLDGGGEGREKPAEAPFLWQALWGHLPGWPSGVSHCTDGYAQSVLGRAAPESRQRAVGTPWRRGEVEGSPAPQEVSSPWFNGAGRTTGRE